MFIPAAWPAPSTVKACTTLRSGGFSQAPYDSFNLAMHVGDQIESVAANRAHLQKILGLAEEPIWLSQIHSRRALAALPENRNQEADACFTQEEGRVCVVLTADCLPLLVCNRQGTEVAAIHAGWRGLAQGLIQETLRQLRSAPSELLVWLGPAIGPEHYEVGEDVYQAFVQQSPEHQSAFRPKTGKTWLADLYTLARQQLAAQGVQAVYGGDLCSFKQSCQFFSYRRDLGKTGRMASLIWLDRSAQNHK